MLYFGHHRGRDSRKVRRPASDWVLEPLESRTLLSSSAGATSAAVSQRNASKLSPIPTSIVLQASTTIAVASESITFAATVENANRKVPVASGRVRFVVESPKHLLLGQVNLNKAGEAGITADKLTKVGSYEIDAEYIPSSSRFSRSLAAPVNVMVNPLTATSFLVTPEVSHGHLGEPMSFTVTALDAQRQPVTNYVGTVAFSSPTDSFTIFSRGFYSSLDLSAADISTILAEAHLIAGLATFPNQEYTFTPADHGSHTFVGGIKFGKAGAEVLRVTQANDAKVVGKTTFAIG